MQETGEQAPAPIVYPALTLEQLMEGAHKISEVALKLGNASHGMIKPVRFAMGLAPAQAAEMLGYAFAEVADGYKVLELPAGATQEQRIAHAKECDEARSKFMAAGNSVRALCQQVWQKEMLPGAKFAAVSIQLNRTDMAAVVTVVAPGASIDDVKAALAHDKKALGQNVKRMEAEARKADDDTKKLAGPAGKEAPEVTDVGGIVGPTGEKIPFIHELSPSQIVSQLTSWDIPRLEKLAALCMRLVSLQRDALAPAPTQITANGTGTAPAAGAPVVDPAPAAVDTPAIAPVSSPAAVVDVSAPVESSTVLTDSAIKSTPTLSDDQKARNVGTVAAPAAPAADPAKLAALAASKGGKGSRKQSAGRSV